MDAPQILWVGDLHLENCGTWRDVDGRLVWGVNDFDEAAVMPYVFDLVRLAASIGLPPTSRSTIGPPRRPCSGDIVKVSRCRSRRCSTKGKHGCVPMPSTRKSSPAKILGQAEKGQPLSAIKGNAEAKPPRDSPRSGCKPAEGRNEHYYRQRVAGVGSLGRPRYVAIAF